MPYYFSGPVYLKEQKLTYPLEFLNLNIKGGIEFKEYPLKQLIEVGIYYYNFSPHVFDYLDAFKYSLSYEIKFKILSPSITIYYTDPFSPLTYKNWSNLSISTGVDLNYKNLNAGFDFETRIFTTNNPADALHYRRKDFRINFYIEHKIKFKILKFYPFFKYEQRFVRNPYQGDLVEILKDYKKFRLGIKFKY